jgi:integrase
MASLELRGGSYRVKFRYGGRQLGCSLKTADERAATAKLKRLEANLHEVEIGRLTVPPGADVPVFLLWDGKANDRPVLERTVTLGQLVRQYKEAGYGGKEVNTRDTEDVHTGHLERVLGARRNVQGITVEVLQGYHTLRHSFASNCAMAGIDQRIIDSWLGHQTPEMSRRYRHLFPHQEQEALAKVFR